MKHTGRKLKLYVVWLFVKNSFGIFPSLLGSRCFCESPQRYSNNKRIEKRSPETDYCEL